MSSDVSGSGRTARTPRDVAEVDLVIELAGELSLKNDLDQSEETFEDGNKETSEQ
jgi:hypothetical protein